VLAHANRHTRACGATTNTGLPQRATAGSAAACRIVKSGEGSYTVTYRAGSDGPEQQLEVGLVMMATGRHPRVKGLNLEVC
jgi:pyruvate/2-oxoglutarate dehydrogenase complex dihydrolipoamide dehydrogenase (E3) component